MSECCINKIDCTDINMNCLNCTCMCIRKHEYDYGRGYCVERKAIPGEQCVDSNDCVEGLECTSSSCRCPLGCKYVSDLGSCDCGTVQVKPPIAAILIGVTLSFVSSFIWLFCIARVCNRKNNPSNSNPILLSQGPRNSFDRLYRQNPIGFSSYPNFRVSPYNKPGAVKGGNIATHGVSPLKGPTRLSPEPSICLSPINDPRGNTPNIYENVQSSAEKYQPVPPIYPAYPPTYSDHTDPDKTFYVTFNRRTSDN
ncbi:UNVERIFIED_CONTAM: hypothetical protein RMT77_001810 [Armadillidium vulgare]